MIDTDKNEEEVMIAECRVCGGDILIDSDCEEEDIVYCNDCETEYLIYSIDPLKLNLLGDDSHADDDGPDDYDEDFG